MRFLSSRPFNIHYRGSAEFQQVPGTSSLAAKLPKFFSTLRLLRLARKMQRLVDTSRNLSSVGIFLTSLLLTNRASTAHPFERNKI